MSRTTEVPYKPSERNNSIAKRHISRAEMTQRLALVEELWLRGLSERRIFAAMEKQFGIGASASRKLLEAVRADIVQRQDENRAVWKAQAMERLLRTISKATDEKDYSAAVSAERLLSDIQGTREPIKMDVRHHMTAAVVRVVGSLTADDMTRMLHEYEELESRALPALDVKAG